MSDLLAASQEIFESIGDSVPKPCACVPEGYAPLYETLKRALARAANGKGAERHATNAAFLNQPIFAIPRALGGSEDPLLFQAVKKIYESKRLPKERAENELLDAIVYLASAVLLMEERND